MSQTVVARQLRSAFARYSLTLGSLILCVALFVVGVIVTPHFASSGSLRVLTVQASFTAIAALGETLVILAGGLDLSVPTLMTFGGIQMAVWGEHGTFPAAVSLALVIVVGAGVGLVNGVGVASIGIPPIVMTLATGALVDAYLLSLGGAGGSALQVPSLAVHLARDTWWGIPVAPILVVALALLASAFLHRTTFGRRIYLVGTNAEAARLAGINVSVVRIGTYSVSGACSVFAGVVLAGYTGQSYLTLGDPYLFAAVAAVVIGGASILGGRGTYWGTLSGAVVLTLIAAVLPALNLAAPALDVVYGVIILIGIALARGSAYIARRIGAT